MYSNILKNVFIPLGDYAMHTKIHKYLNQIKKLNRLSKNEIKHWQSDRLRQLIEHSYNNTVFYKELFDAHKIKIDDIRTVEDLRKIPTLTKNDIKKNYDKLVAKNAYSIPHIIKKTGGSTGEPLVFLMDKDSWSFINANTILNWERSSYRYGDKYVSLGSTSLFVNEKKSLKHWVYYQLKGNMGLNGINMSDETCLLYLNLIEKKGIKYLYGYASALYLLAKYALNNNYKTNIKVCFTTSEVLTPVFRDTIFKAFHCQIVDCYGAHDGGIIAFNHTNDYFEVGYNCIVNTDDNNNALLTNLFNYAMPFINYQVGDGVELYHDVDDLYAYNGQVIKSVNGRQSEILKFSNNRTITGPGFTILFKEIPVEYYCLEKTTDSSVICWYTSNEALSKQIESLILLTLSKQLGDEVKIDLKQADTPFLSKSGKQKYIIDSAPII